MRYRVREHAAAGIGASVGILVVGWLALTDWAWTDYDREARPAFDALVSGHLFRFLELAPAYGGSLLLRAPFVLVPKLWGGGELATFRAAAAPCLIASAVLGVWIVSKLRGVGATKIAKAVALFLCVANPMTLSALEAGHPEELLGAVLCIGAVLAATRKHALWAGILLGLAIANKEWAVVAIGPVLIALPERRVRALIAAGAVVAAVLLPLVAAGGFAAQVKGAATPVSSIFTPWQVWWFIGPHAHVIPVGQPWATRVEPAWLGQLAHPLIIALAALLTCLCAWLRYGGRRRPANEALLLLIVVLLLRCMLDPWDNTYYPLPFLLALVAWDALTFQRPPVLALAGSFAAWFVFQWAVPSQGLGPDAQSLIFLAFALPALTAIMAALCAPVIGERLLLSLRPRAGLPNPV